MEGRRETKHKEHIPGERHNFLFVRERVYTICVFYTYKKKKSVNSVSLIHRWKAKSYVMENCLCTILRNSCYWFSTVVAISLASRGVPLLSRNPSKLESFFFRRAKPRETSVSPKGEGRTVDKQETKFCTMGGVSYFLLCLCTRLQKLHHLSARVACAVDNFRENVVNHFAPIKLTCVIIITAIVGEGRKNTYVYTCSVFSKNVHLTYTRLSLTTKLSPPDPTADYIQLHF